MEATTPSRPGECLLWSWETFQPGGKDGRTGANYWTALYGECRTKKNFAALRDTLEAGQKRRGIRLMYDWIQSQHQEEPSLPVTRLCSAFGVSRSGYYDWLHRPEPTQSEEDMEIRDQIQRIVLEFPGYGYRRVTPELRRRGYVVARNRVLEMMREDNLLCLRKRHIFRTTDSSHKFPAYLNLVREIHQ